MFWMWCVGQSFAVFANNCYVSYWMGYNVPLYRDWEGVLNMVQDKVGFIIALHGDSCLWFSHNLKIVVG